MNLTSVISPTTLNEFKFGYSFSDIANDLPGITDDFTGLQFHPDRELMGEIDPGSGAESIGWENLGSFYTQKGLTFKDDLSLSYGNHSLRLGGGSHPLPVQPSELQQRMQWIVRLQ